LIEFLRNNKAIYFVGKRAARELHIREFLTEASDVLDDPLLARLPELSWKETLQACVQRHRGASKLIIALDEFQWIVEGAQELTGVLQELWDREWRDSGKVMLILCGSYVGFMEREVLGHKSPLFGRRTGQIFLRPFNYREAALFHSSFGTIERAKAYFICGGIPHYLKQFSGQHSVESAIATAILSEDGPLFREADFLLHEELREVANYYAVLLVLADGRRSTAAEIAKRTGLGPSAQYHLKQLLELGYIEKRFPLTSRKPKRTDVRYAISDPLLRFWFRFVFPNQSFLQSRGGHSGLRDRIKPHLASYFGDCFERLCREALPWLQQREGLDCGVQLGSFWNKQNQIDVVGVRDDGWIDLGECKWGSVRSARRLQQELEAKIPHYPNPDGASLLRRFFTRKTVRSTARASGVRWHTLEELYAGT